MNATSATNQVLRVEPHSGNIQFPFYPIDLMSFGEVGHLLYKYIIRYVWCMKPLFIFPRYYFWDLDVGFIYGNKA